LGLLVLAFGAKAEFGIEESSPEETEKARKIGFNRQDERV
jgi:hypothetical protein